MLCPISRTAQSLLALNDRDGVRALTASKTVVLGIVIRTFDTVLFFHCVRREWTEEMFLLSALVHGIDAMQHMCLMLCCFCGKIWEASCRQALGKSVGGECCRRALSTSVGERVGEEYCKEVSEKSVVEKCWRRVL